MSYRQNEIFVSEIESQLEIIDLILQIRRKKFVYCTVCMFGLNGYVYDPIEYYSAQGFLNHINRNSILDIDLTALGEIMKYKSNTRKWNRYWVPGEFGSNGKVYKL
jgi:adenosine deaminase